MRDLLPRGGLRVAHVLGLIDQLNKRDGGPWKTRFEGRWTGGQYAIAMIFELHHPAGGKRYLLFELDIAAAGLAGVRGRLGNRSRVAACTLHIRHRVPVAIGGRASSPGPLSCMMIDVTMSLEPT